ncbi:hypothetical protein GCM10007036_39300 [Alsobacter metallidurans]|uniref:Uncharacterized protein n=1 Tax=Alsobacter metallidurans TaxID=340221 RepID=A0A917IAZ4_9HYPH|nr:hypothetical protein GCM10007036_39300 [Alsobacter metallidurans]
MMSPPIRRPNVSHMRVELQMVRRFGHTCPPSSPAARRAGKGIQRPTLKSIKDGARGPWIPFPSAARRLRPGMTAGSGNNPVLPAALTQFSSTFQKAGNGIGV